MLSQNDFEEQEDTDLEGHSQSVMVILLCAGSVRNHSS